ncbi:MAG: B12-binding domain-containing radical SAM protein [Planctomycetes bacterium]|nr:B12-binding domain-containing radical SAM protein [Planctomycetota bacterium]
MWLVQPPVGGGPSDVSPPLGLLLLAAIIREAGFTPHLVDLNLRSKQGRIDTKRSLRNQFVQSLPKRSSQIDLIAVTTWSYNFDVTMEFVEAVHRKHPGVPIVLGGPHATFVDEEILRRFPSVDYVVRDEGDASFPALLRAISEGASPAALGSIPGLTWRNEGEVVRNPSGGVTEDLDALPYPAYDLIDAQEYVRQHPVLVVEAGRGCPYNCNFCSTTNMFQRKYRVKTPARLVDEVEWLIEQTGSNRFEFLHDNLVASKKYIRELCAEIRERNLDVEWSCTSRTDNLTEDLAQEMFLAGCCSIFFGVESLDADRQAWTGKKLKPERIHAAIELTRRQHISPNTGIILGFPDETERELNLTVEAALRWTTDPKIRAEVSTAMLRYYPGADLFQHADKLKFDALAARDAAALPGYVIREEWREDVRLFPLQTIHTPPQETRQNLVRRDLVRTLLSLAPHTFRACVDALGETPRALLDAWGEFPELEAALQARSSSLETRNACLRALTAWVMARGVPQLSELLQCEIPFCEAAQPMIAPGDRLEHILLPKRFVQEELLAWSRGAPLPSELEPGTSILAIRTGPEAVVWFTDKPQDLLDVFEQSYKDDRAGTVEYVNTLRRGL